MTSDREPWTIGLGRWYGIDLRLHISFLIALLFLMLSAWREGTENDTSFAGLTIVFIVVWFVSVIIHEFGHMVVDHRLNSTEDGIALSPIGGLRSQRFHRAFAEEMVPILAGPMVSATLALVCFALVRFRQDVGFFQLMHPESFSAILSTSDGEVSWLLAIGKIAVCVNGWIVIANLIPAIPTDAGRGGGALMRQCYPDWDARRLSLWMCIISRGMALLLLFLAVILHQVPGTTIAPLWLILLTLSVSVYFSARGEEERLASRDDDDDAFGYDFSQGYTSLERDRPPLPQRRSRLQRWLLQLRRRWQQRQARIEAEEDRRVDSILARLHSEGLHNLLPSERALLRRASARYRNRQSK